MKNLFESARSQLNKILYSAIVLIALFFFVSFMKPTYDVGILAGTLIDGRGGGPQTNQLILIKDGKIVAIVDAAKKDRYNYHSFIDAHDKFIIPGLIEMHGHVTMTHRKVIPLKDSPFGIRMTVSYDRAAALWTLQTLLDYGITTVRETGDFLQEGLQLKKEIEEKKILGPYLFTCGPLIESEPRIFREMSVTVNSEADARREVQRQIAAGVDFIKIYASLRPELSRAVIDEAHKSKTRVLGHVQTTSCLQALSYGVDAFVHPLFFMGTTEADSIQKAFEIMQAKHIPMDIQLTPFGSNTRELILGETAEAISFKAAMPDTIKKGYEQQIGQFYPADSLQSITQQTDSLILAHARLAKKAGVPLFLGTDFGNPYVVPGLSFHREMEGFLKAGFSPAEIIRIATRDQAEWLGILNRKGTLETGKDADLVILDASPLDDIRNSTKIVHVFREGRMVK